MSLLYQGRNKHGIFLLAIHLDFSVIFNISCYLNIILTWETFHLAGEPWQTGMYYFICYDVFSFTRNMFSPIMNELSFTKLCVHTKRSAKIVLGSSTLLPYDITDFAVLSARRHSRSLLAGNSLFFWISCDLEVTNKRASCWENISAILQLWFFAHVPLPGQNMSFDF